MKHFAVESDESHDEEGSDIEVAGAAKEDAGKFAKKAEVLQ
jgi:hypothetical protein